MMKARSTPAADAASATAPVLTANALPPAPVFIDRVLAAVYIWAIAVPILPVVEVRETVGAVMVPVVRVIAPAPWVVRAAEVAPVILPASAIEPLLAVVCTAIVSAPTVPASDMLRLEDRLSAPPAAESVALEPI